MSSLFKVLVAFIGAATLAAAHGAPESAAVLQARAAAVEENIRLVRSCEQKLLRRGHIDKRMQRREEFIKNYIKKKSQMEGREITPNPNVFKREHALSERAVDCVLAPEVTVGPYYLPNMLVRPDIREGQPGVPLLLDVQVVDVNTCNILPKVTIDFWSCNSTGSYSGFAQERTAGLTHHRGIATSDPDGLIHITSNFPGWYAGRATHLHIAAHHNATIANEHIAGGTVSHIGQVFFPEPVLSEIDVADVYRTITASRLRNAQDFIFGQQNSGYNALATVTRVGARLQDGLIAAITVGVNPRIDRTTTLNSGGAMPGFPGFPGFPGSPTTPAPAPTIPTSTVLPPTLPPPSSTTHSTTAPTPAPTSGGNLPKFSQCGGIGWAGSGTCVTGTTCQKLNDWYSQCV